jgi:hypothetical protein
MGGFYSEALHGKRAMACLFVSAALLVMSVSVTAPVRGQEAQQEIYTGPIDPAAGAWMTYRGERVVPEQPEPQVFTLRVAYDLPSEPSQYGKLVEGTETEFDASGQAVSARTSLVQTIDRFYRVQDGSEEGYWRYWLTPGLDEGDAASVGEGTKLTADEVQDLEFKGDTFAVVRLRGDGIEILVEQRTGLVFSLAKDGGETLRIDDTNMLAQHDAWEYIPVDATVGRRLEILADEHPDLVEVSSLGKSALGRSIWLARVTDYTSSEAKNSVVITAAVEGDAPEGCAFLLDLLEELVERAAENDSTAALLRQLNIYAVPLVNPDGIQRWLAMPSPGESPLLASQAPRNANLVHIDRNFDVKWEGGDRNPNSPDHAGPTSFSEPESQALKRLFEDVPVHLFLSLHGGSDLISAPWNWSGFPDANPEIGLYESILSDLSDSFGLPVRVGAPPVPFTGSSTDWAYEGGGISSPICFDLYLHGPDGIDNGEEGGEEGEEKGGFLSSYAAHRETIYELMENLRSYIAVDINAPGLKVEVNVPIDAVVEITVSGMRALPNARVRLILPENSSLKFSSMAEKEVLLGDLEPGSSTQVTWNLEGRAGGSNTAAIVLTSSYAEYENIPGTYGADLAVSISTQRTWLVLVLLSIMVLLVLGLVLLSMRKHRKVSGRHARGDPGRG